MPDPKPWTIAPYFLVRDVVATANWYRDQLGFSHDKFWGDPVPCFTMVYRRGITIMLNQPPDVSGKPVTLRPNHKSGSEGDHWDAYIWVDDPDGLYAEFKAKGVNITREICDQPYGCRDFDVEDCNGYRLCFGG